MTWLALRALLRRVPGIAWVIAGAVVLAAFGLWFTYRAGAKHEALHAHRAALADSVQKETVVHETAKAQTDSARGVAHTAQRFADASRTKRQGLRDSVEDLLDSLPAPVVALIHLDDQQIRRDSVALVAYIAVDTALVAEREAAAHLDTLHQHQARVGIDPPKPHRVRYAVAGAVVALAGAFLFHAVR